MRTESCEAASSDLLVGLLVLPLAKGADQNFHVALGLFLLGLGEEHARFDVHEMGGHGDEFAGDLHVHALALVEPGKVLLENGGDVHVLNFNFIFAEQQEDDIQRAVEIFEGLGPGADDAVQVVYGFVHTNSPIRKDTAEERPFSKPVRRKFSGVSSTSAKSRM